MSTLSRWMPGLALLLLSAGLGRAAEPASPQVETGGTSLLGRAGLTLNGRIQPHGLPTRYYFEYGATPAYGSRTAELPLPGKLAAYYRETFEHGLAGWKGGMSGKDLMPLREEASGKTFARFAEPSGDDPNHVDGIGTLHLSTYFYPGVFNAGGTPWGGAEPDLRDAKVRLAVRGNGWVPNGSELVWWTQADADPAKKFAPDWRRANWAYTGYSLTDLLTTGKWETAEYRLTNDSENWTYGGNNLAQKRPNYTYFSIDRCQANIDCDVFHLLAFVDPARRPQGSFDVAEFELAYRNHSLVFPANGGKLIASPPSEDNPALLTDGWRHGAGRQWKSAANPAAPLEFHYELANPVQITAIQLHQNSEWPIRDVEVEASEDGQTWTSLLKESLPESSPSGPNFANVLKRGLNTKARQVRVRILSGYRPQHWGLGEIELFGTGAIEQTDDDWYSVNTDLGGLTGGTPCHYRLVAVNSTGTVVGPDRAATPPDNDKPVCVTQTAIRLKPTAATLTGRLCPMGQRTEFFFEYGPTQDLGQKTARLYGGLQITSRLAQTEIADLKPATTYYYRLAAENAAGTSAGEIREFRTTDVAQ